MFEFSYWIIPLIYFENTFKILIIQQSKWHFWFPKWHWFKWELQIETAKREFFEETWISPEKLDFFNDLNISDTYLTQNKNWKNISKIVKYFLAKIIWFNESEIKINNTEIIDYKICKFDDLYAILKFKNTKLFLDNLSVLLNRIK